MLQCLKSDFTKALHASSVYHPSPISLDPSGSLKRDSVRPLIHRGPEFDQAYDAHTLIYDAVRVSSCDVFLLCPPLRNLRTLMEKAHLTAPFSSKPCPFVIQDLDRHTRIHVKVPNGTSHLIMTSEAGTFELPVPQSGASLFEGRRVLFTQSKNNEIDWILDWVRYHRDVHGADAVLIYDNASTAYAPEDLSEALYGLTGIQQARVVSWPFKFGPQGIGSKQFWDSDYCQHGSLEHGRWHFLSRASSVMVADIDELLLCHQPDQTLFECAEAALSGILRYRGSWMFGFEHLSPDHASSASRRHRDYQHVSLIDPCPPKYTLVPHRVPCSAQWKIHNVSGWRGMWPLSRQVSYRHFREINSSWKYDRNHRYVFDPKIHKLDKELMAAFNKVDWNR